MDGIERLNPSSDNARDFTKTVSGVLQVLYVLQNMHDASCHGNSSVGRASIKGPTRRCNFTFKGSITGHDL